MENNPPDPDSLAAVQGRLDDAFANRQKFLDTTGTPLSAEEQSQLREFNDLTLSALTAYYNAKGDLSSEKDKPR